MTVNTVKFLLSDGSTIHVETAAGPSGEEADDSAAGVEIVPRFERAASRLQPLAQTMLEQVKSADPGKVAIAFALKFDASGEPVVAAGDDGAAFRITLEWQRGARAADQRDDRRRGRPFEGRGRDDHRGDDRRGGYDDRRGDDRRGDDRRGGYDDRRGPPRGGGSRRPGGYRRDRD